ncbi:hypothetical protein A2V82_01975 [candidate division KSB1 bacterium RBG_16_48_16]|nr:MAG: hypothetical protein A2V82_01975 [candidate division KSB1 bacterium RBG_16_48_16]
MKKVLLKISPYMGLLLLWACAKQGFPPGGPVDKTSPRILDTYPANGSTLIPPDTRIEFIFNEGIDHPSCEESIFITPYPGEEVKYKWRGKKLRVEIPGGLLPNRTYVITIGTGSRDRRNNAMKESFSLAFSTGENLDDGVIEGNVYGKGRVEGTQIRAYDIVEMPDPNPSATPPIYITQASADGRFKMSYLALSRYRLFAMNDRDGNGLYDPEYDAIGVASKDVLLAKDNNSIRGLNFQVAVRDTTPPVLKDVSVPDRIHLTLVFSEPMDSTYLSEISNVDIFSPDDSLEILALYHDRHNPAYLHVLTKIQQAGKKYTVSVKQGTDLWGLPLVADSSRVEFSGSDRADSTRPAFLEMTPKDSTKTVSVDQSIHLLFSDFMDTTQFLRHVTLMDTLGNKVGLRALWPNLRKVYCYPDTLLGALTDYNFIVNVDSVFDYAGNALADTLFKKSFKTLNPDTLSSISGRIHDADSLAKGRFHIRAAEKKGGEYAIWTENDAVYSFKNVMPGLYTLEIFRDEDEDGRFSYGQPFPYRPADRFYVYSDTIDVRSKWPNEGNDIIFPR